MHRWCLPSRPLFAISQAVIGSCSEAQEKHLWAFGKRVRGCMQSNINSRANSGTEPRMAGLKAENDFLKCDAVCISETEHSGRKEFVCEGPLGERQLRWRGCSFHLVETRRLPTINDRNRRAGDQIVFEQSKSDVLLTAVIALVAAVSMSRHAIS